MKKLLCLLLAMLMVLPLAVACNNNEKPPVSTGDNAGNNTGDDTDGSSGTPARAHSIPAGTSFDNEDYYSVAFEWQGYLYYFFAEDESSNPMESALYNRQRAIEEEIDVTMKHYLYPASADLVNAVEQDVRIGQTEIDTALLHCINGAATFSSNGYLYPIEKLEYVDLEADWWNLEQMDTLRASKHYYFAVNDYMIPCPYVIFFNKEMVEDMADMPDPYELVLDQKWTFDEFEKMARAATIDLNTDGLMDTENDSFGIHVEESSKYCSFWPAFDQPVTGRDEDGKIIIDMNSEKTADIIARFADLNRAGVMVTDERLLSTTLDDFNIDTGRILFFLAPISYAENYRNCEVATGMLPYPKYDEAQENYRSLDWGGLMCVPNCVENPDLVGAVMELLAFKAEEKVLPTYYDVVVDGQLAQDPNTVKMLDILFETNCYDPGMNFWGLSSPFMQLFFVISHHVIVNNDGNWASLWARYGESTQRQIDTYYQTLELYEDYNEALN